MADLDSPTGINFRSPYGNGTPGGYGARAGRYMNPRVGDPFGAGIDNLGKIMLSGATPAQQDAQAALAADRDAQTRLRNAQLAEIAQKLTDAADAKARQASALPSAITAKFGVPGQETLDYISGNGPKAPVVPQPETDTQPGIMGGYDAPVAPEGLTPDKESAVRRLVAGFNLAGGLSGKTNLEQFNKAQQEDMILDAVNAARGDPAAMSRAATTSMAFKGTSPFTTNGAGATTNVYTGGVDTNNPLAQANIGEKNAAAGASNASAASHYATAAKTKSETLPQTTLPGPNGTTVPVLGKDVSKAATTAAFTPSELSPEAIAAAAARYRVDGTLPTNLGRGTQGARNTALILNAAAADAAASGQTGEAERIRQIATKSTQKALSNTINVAAGIDRSGAILDRHFGILEGLAKQFDPGRLQILNKAILAGEQQFNDPLANQYAAQLQQVMLEYGKLKAGPNSQAMLPVEAIHLGQKALSTGIDVPSLEAIHRVVNQDVQINREEAARETALLRSTMAPPSAPGAAPAAPAPAAPAAAAAPDPLEGRTATGPNGQKLIRRGGKWVPLQ